MPQLSQIGEIYASQLFWLMIVFALIYFGIGKAMVPRIEKTVDDRQARITTDLAAAESARAVAHDAEAKHMAELDVARSTALSSVNAAKAKGSSAAEAQVKAADAVHAQSIAEAETRISTAKAGALSEIEAFTVEAVEAIVAKVSGVTVDRSVVAQQVQAELSHV